LSPSSGANETTVRGLLLSRVVYGDADFIVHLFTEQLGKIAALARGARRSQKRFGGALEPLHTLVLRVQGRPHVELFTLKEAELSRTRQRVTESLSAMETAGRALSWVKKSAPPHTPEPLVWEALERLLDELEGPSELDHDSLLASFGVQLLEGLGWGLELSRCVSCSKPCRAGQSAWVNPERGGLICRFCGGGPVLLPGPLRNLLLELVAKQSFAPLGEHATLGLKLIERAILAHMGS